MAPPKGKDRGGLRFWGRGRDFRRIPKLREKGDALLAEADALAYDVFAEVGNIAFQAWTDAGGDSDTGPQVVTLTLPARMQEAFQVLASKPDPGPGPADQEEAGE